MTINPTKQRVVEAASMLFYQKGFHGTTVRDIAKNASVNVSLISYYFDGKQGLLEYAVTNYYEMYLLMLDEQLEKHSEATNVEKLKKIIQAIIVFKTDYFQLTSLINRELSLDSTFVREMTVTYLAKENHTLSELFFPILNKNHQRNRHYLYMQLKGMLLSPYVVRNEWNNELIDRQSLKSFITNYTETIMNWIDYLTK